MPDDFTPAIVQLRPYIESDESAHSAKVVFQPIDSTGLELITQLPYAIEPEPELQDMEARFYVTQALEGGRPLMFLIFGDLPDDPGVQAKFNEWPLRLPQTNRDDLVLASAKLVGHDGLDLDSLDVLGFTDLHDLRDAGILRGSVASQTAHFLLYYEMHTGEEGLGMVSAYQTLYGLDSIQVADVSKSKITGIGQTEIRIREDALAYEQSFDLQKLLFEQFKRKSSFRNEVLYQVFGDALSNDDLVQYGQLYEAALSSSLDEALGVARFGVEAYLVIADITSTPAGITIELLQTVNGKPVNISSALGLIPGIPDSVIDAGKPLIIVGAAAGTGVTVYVGAKKLRRIKQARQGLNPDQTPESFFRSLRLNDGVNDGPMDRQMIMDAILDKNFGELNGVPRFALPKPVDSKSAWMERMRQSEFGAAWNNQLPFGTLIPMKAKEATIHHPFPVRRDLQVPGQVTVLKFSKRSTT